jgi:glutamine synthetase
MYEYSERQGLEIDTLIHESGVAQMEINLRHGNPLELADQVFMFKRTIREVALEHEIYATFMAKPMASEPGSAMHIHQSIVDKDGQNLFSDPKTGEETAAVPQLHRRPADLSAGDHGDPGALREFLPPDRQGERRAGQHPVGL